MLNLIRAICLFIVVSGFFCGTAVAAERKDPTAIDSVALTTETQRMSNDSATLDLVWWVPVEFWEAAFRQDPSLSRQDADNMLAAMRPYFLMIVIQTDITPYGEFNFLPLSRISGGLQVSYTDDRGNRTALPVLASTNAEFEEMLTVLRPLLANAMGNMGQNFHFFAFSAEDKNGNRMASPYEAGTISVSLNSRRDSAPVVFEFDAPLDSLFVPRICPNGKPAHISWNFCPWDGSRLPR